MMTFIQMMDRMNPIVDKCLHIHGGGEDYFTELDGFIKNDYELVCDYVNYAVKEEKCKHIISTGEIGERLKEYQANGYLKKSLTIISVSGGLRCGAEVGDLSDVIEHGQDYIFIDDSFYSGKTFRKVENAVEEAGGDIVRAYVFYDGSKEYDSKVRSLYRYYREQR